MLHAGILPYLIMSLSCRKWGFPYYRDPLDPSSATKYNIARVPFTMGAILTTVKEGYY